MRGSGDPHRPAAVLAGFIGHIPVPARRVAHRDVRHESESGRVQIQVQCTRYPQGIKAPDRPNRWINVTAPERAFFCE